MTGLVGALAPARPAAGPATTPPTAAGLVVPAGPVSAQLIDALAGLALALAGT